MPDPTRPIESEYRRELAKAHEERRTAERDRAEARQRAERADVYERALIRLRSDMDKWLATFDRMPTEGAHVWIASWKMGIDAALAAAHQPDEAGGEEG